MPKNDSKDTRVPEAATEIEVETCQVDEVSSVLQDEEKPEKGFTSSDSYNGAVFENYSWSQTITEVDVVVKVPPDVTTKQLSVVILPSRVSVKLKDSGEVLLEGELCKKCKHSSAIWSLEKGKMEIHLEKTIEAW